MSKKFEAIKEKVEKLLSVVFQETELRKILNQLQVFEGFSDSTKYKIQKSAKKINLNWSRQPHIRLLTFAPEVEPLEVILALCGLNTKYYISHYPALYWNELVEQRPKTFYISREVPSHVAIHTKDYNEDLVKQVFMKSPRHTTHSLKINNLEAFIIEKQNLERSKIIKSGPFAKLLS